MTEAMKLTGAEEEHLHIFVHRGKANARSITRARVLLKLYEAFPPAEARRILQRIEFHYTPKHGSWLNMAEIEIAILERNALSRRLEDEVALRRQVSAVETERNQQRRGITWQFTSHDASIKLERLYPVKARSSD